MTVTPIIKNHRRNYGSAELAGESRPQVAERLIRETRTTLDRFGINWSPSKASRVVRVYMHHVQGNGYDFGDYIATQVAVAETQRKVIADELRKVVSYADPVGERAVNNVVRASAGIAS